MKSIYFKKCLYLVGISVVIFFTNIIFKLDIIKIPSRSDLVDFNFNLITINSIIAGFSFTTLGIITGLAGTEIVLKISKTDIMSEKSRKIVTSIVYCCISIVISMIFILQLNETVIFKVINWIFKKNGVLIYNRFMELIYLMCIIFLLGGFIYFLKSIREVSRLIAVIYKNKSKLTPKRVIEMQEVLKKQTIKKQNFETDQDTFTKE